MSRHYYTKEDPEVGDRVLLRYTGECYSTYNFWPGWSQVARNLIGLDPTEGIVGEVVHVGPHERSVGILIAVVRATGYKDFIIGVRGLNLLDRAKVVSIDPSKIKHTRDGRPVASVTVSDDLQRPLRANVHVNDQWLTLTFQANGRFYERVDQGIDLVEGA